MHLDQTMFIFSLVTQGCAYATVCGISYSSKKANSHMTLKLGFGGVQYFKDESVQAKYPLDRTEAGNFSR